MTEIPSRGHGEHSDSDRLIADGGEADGLVTLESDAAVGESVERVKAVIDEKEALGLMAEFDHEANAESVDQDLLPTTVLVFGNPDLGTPLMQSNRTLAIDLPQKLLVTEREDGTVTVAYNDPKYLAKRHGIEDEDERIETISDALSSLAAVAAGNQ